MRKQCKTISEKEVIVAEDLDKKEQRQWGKAVERMKYVKGDDEPELGQKKVVEKLVARGLKATPKKEREEDLQKLLPKKSDREVD